MKYIPKKGKRWCTICNQFQKFRYDRVIRHSYCHECGTQAGLTFIKDIEKAINYLYDLKVKKTPGHIDKFKKWRIEQFHILDQIKSKEVN